MAESSLPSPHDLFDHAACGLLLTDAGGTILRANRTGVAWLGYERPELESGMRLQDLLSIGGRVFYQTHCEPLLHLQGTVSEIQIDLVRRDGTRVPALLNIARRDTDTGPLHHVAIFTAGDRRKYERELLQARADAEAALAAQSGAEERLRQANEELSTADRRKDEFLATLSHELRNPLAPMRSGLEVLRATLPPDAATMRVVGMFDRQVRQMAHLVDDLMEVTRISRGKLSLHMEAVRLNDIVQGAVDDLGDRLRTAGHSLRVVLPETSPCVHADPTRLTQVIANLLTNACKYTPDGGTIELDVRTEGLEAVIAVKDSGIGIHPAALEAIFEMFSQLEPALRRSHGGLGIGLALVRGLVRLHGGTVTAHSDGPGTGCTFTVRLPLLNVPGEACPAEHAAAAGSRLRILVVDDNVDAAEMLGAVLSLRGHAVRIAHSARQALDYLADGGADACLFDIGLPDMDGYALARQVRASQGNPPPLLIALTGWGQADDVRAALAAGFDHHLTKPVDTDQLLAVLERRG